MFRSGVLLFLINFLGSLGTLGKKACEESDVEWIFLNRPPKKSALMQSNNVHFKQCVLHCYNTYQCSSSEQNGKSSRFTTTPQTAKWEINSIESEWETPMACYKPQALDCGLLPSAPENFCRRGWKLQCYPAQMNTPYCVCDPATQPKGCDKVCNYIFRNKWDFPRVGDLQGVEVSNVSECLDYCQNTPGCASVVYNVLRKSCWAKDINEFTAPEGSLVHTELAELYSLFCPPS